MGHRSESDILLDEILVLSKTTSSILESNGDFNEAIKNNLLMGEKMRRFTELTGF